MASYKKTNTKCYSKATSITTADSQYWKNFEFPVTVKEFSIIHHIDVSPIEPYYIAVTTGPKVDLYHQQSAQVWKSLDRFHSNAYCGTFREDGKLLVAGSEEAQVKLFNYRQKQLLRVFRGHKGPVQCTKFIHGKQHVASFSDDKTIKLWDVAAEKQICEMTNHKDFIRAGASSPTSEHIIVSGSYDHEMKMWDTRTGNSVMTFDHGKAISSVLFYPTGCVFASSGGSEVKIWDAVGGKLLSILSHNNRDITCLSLASDNQRLLVGSLDQHIKVYDLNTYKPVHTMEYPAPILSMAVAPMDSTLVTGMLSKGANPMVGGTGLISFEHKKVIEENPQLSKRKAKDPLKYMPLEAYSADAHDEISIMSSRERMSKYDRLMRTFQYSKALDAVTQNGIMNKQPHVTIAVIRELIRRNALKAALAGRNAKSLVQIFKFITKQIRNPAYVKIVSEVANCLLELYGDEFSEDNKMLLNLKRFNEELESELSVTKGTMELLGILDLFSSVSRNVSRTEESGVTNTTSSHPSPSNDAKNFKVVVDIR